jgi:hypothetical protein
METPAISRSRRHSPGVNAGSSMHVRIPGAQPRQARVSASRRSATDPQRRCGVLRALGEGSSCRAVWSFQCWTARPGWPPGTSWGAPSAQNGSGARTEGATECTQSNAPATPCTRAVARTQRATGPLVRAPGPRFFAQFGRSGQGRLSRELPNPHQTHLTHLTTGACVQVPLVTFGAGPALWFSGREMTDERHNEERRLQIDEQARTELLAIVRDIEQHVAVLSARLGATTTERVRPES